MKLKNLVLCASLACCSHPRPQQIFGACLVDRERNEIIHVDLIYSFRHHIPSNLDNRFPIRCNSRSAFFISSDGFLNGIHATSNLNSPFSLFMTQSDLRRAFPILSNYLVSQNGEITLHFVDGSIHRFSIILD